MRWRKYLLGRKGRGEQIPAIGLIGAEFDGNVVVWIHPNGKASLFKEGKLIPEAQRIVDKRAGILAVDVFLTGEFDGAKPPPVDKKYAGFTFGYNRPLLASRVHDVLTAVAFAKSHEKTKAVYLLGLEQAGPWVALARALCGDSVRRTAVDFNQFRFEDVKTTDDAMMLPGALKYSGLPAFAALTAPGELLVHHGADPAHCLTAAFAAAKAEDHLQHTSEKASIEKIIDWLLR